MNAYVVSGGEISDEDGQLKSPTKGAEYSDEENTCDSLYIKPPQATKMEFRYKDKKNKKQHSRDRKHKEKHHREHRNRERAYEGATSKSERDLKYDESKQYYKEKEQYYKSQQRSDIREDYREKGLKHTKNRESNRFSPDGNHSDNDKLLEDLRSRLINRRYQNDYYEPGRDSSKHENYERKSKRDFYGNREKRDRGASSTNMEGNEEYEGYDNEPTSKNRQFRTAEEKDIRRNKLLLAEREMSKRKLKAREELLMRREQRRERNGEDSTDENSSPEQVNKRSRSSSTEDKNKHYKTEKGKVKVRIETEDVVMLSSDHSHDNDEDNDEVNSVTSSETMSDISDKDFEDLELDEVSPIDQLMKSDRRKNARTTISRSKTPIARSTTKSRTPSESRSRIHSRSRSNSSSQSRSSNSSSDENNTQDRLKKENSTDNEENTIAKDKPKIENEISATTNTECATEKEEDSENTLPAYYPAIQGCRSVEMFECLNRIEEGTYGVVYRAKDKRTNEIVALKRLKMEKEKEGFPITSLREINTLLKGQHPNIVTVREIVVGSNMDKIFIVMDYVEHDLKSLIETMKHKNQKFFPAEVKCLIQQLTRAVAHLHDNWILHRDLKTSNLLLSHKGILKVGDFGLAREYGSPLKAYTSIVVTLWYRAPELLLGCKEYSTPIDMWSVGCIFAELLSMMALFPGKSEGDQLNRIFKDLGTPNERIWPGYDELPLVKKMTFAEYPVSQLRKKFSSHTSELGLSLLQGMLTYDPKKRLSADEALKQSYFQELPLPIDPAMFPTWPAKSEVGWKRAMATSPKPPSGGGQFKKLEADEENTRFSLSAGYATYSESRQLSMGPGFSLKF